MAATRPLADEPAPVDYAALVAQQEAVLAGVAKAIKDIGLNLVDQKTSSALLRLTEQVRRCQFIAARNVLAIQNDQALAALENGGDLPPDASAVGTLFPITNKAASYPGSTTVTTALPPYLAEYPDKAPDEAPAHG